MLEIRTTTTTCTTDKTDKKITIILLAGINYCANTEHKLLDSIYSKLTEKTVKNSENTYICLAGDLIDETIVLEDKKLTHDLQDFIDKLARFAPVIMVKGNRDISNQNYSRTHSIPADEKLIEDTLKNITFLNSENPNYCDENININGINMPLSFYEDNKEDKKMFGSALENIKFNYNDKFTACLFHSPSVFLENSEIDLSRCINLSKTDLFLSAHFHSGLLPKFVTVATHGKGFYVSSKPLFYDIRDNEDFKNKTLVVSKGIEKLANVSPIFDKVNNLYRPDICNVVIEPSKQKIKI